MGDVTHEGRSSLFRSEAFEYHFREQESRGVLNTSIRHPWLISLASMALLGAALTYTVVARVEVVYRVEGTMTLAPVRASLKSGRLAIAYVYSKPDLSLRPGARVRLELLRPISGHSQFVDGRLTALARAPLRLEIVLDQPVEGTPLPVRIHAVGCRQSLLRFALDAASGCPER